MALDAYRAALSPGSDISSPYFLSSSDNPGFVLVTQVLTGDNFYSWLKVMVVALEAKSKMQFVNGSLISPAPGAGLVYLWRRCDSMVKSCLLNAVSKEIACSIVSHVSARAVWLDLAERFSQGNKPRIFQLTELIMNLRQSDASVTVYYTRFKTLWDELSNYDPIPSCDCGVLRGCTCGILTRLYAKHEEKCVMQFLMGLNAE